MVDPRGFLKVARKNTEYRPICERLDDHQEVFNLPSLEHSREQASRCMDCATPFCHWGCPLGNYIPEWNSYMFGDKWPQAVNLLEATNNLAEITGRVCPAVCEYSCVLGLNSEAVTIRENELALIEAGFKNGLIKPKTPTWHSGKKVALVGSGPAGLSCAAQLNQAGHKVVVFERDQKPGGILRYGIPDFKLEKWILDRRIEILKKEGIQFKTGFNVEAKNFSLLQKDFDAVCLTGGSDQPRDLKIPGRELKGIYFAMDYLSQANRLAAGEKIDQGQPIEVKGKKVVIIGGGDTGSDCLGTALRQRAACLVQIELLPQPPECRSQDFPWPHYPLILKTSSSHQEGGQRVWSVLTKSFIGKKGCLEKLSCVRVEFKKSNSKGCPIMKEIKGSEFQIEADIAILALGFLHPRHSGLLSQLKVGLDARGNVKTDDSYRTSLEKVFSAGDMRRGQSLVVWAIQEGRQAAFHIDKYLTGESDLGPI